ncbi:MAG: TIM barrel protein [Saprospiraceae bacterium]|nr:TIM barrel protein [Saprospiraceae bacterium]
MKRRNFIQNTLAASAALLSGSPLLAGAPEHGPGATAQAFKLNYAPHDGMFKHSAGDDFLDQIRFMADQGFTAIEDNGMGGRTREMQEKIGGLLNRLNMTMGVFVANRINWSEGTLASGDPDARAAFLQDIRGAVDVARRVNAKWMTVVPNCVFPKLDPHYQSAHVVESLRRAADILEPQGLVMVLEPLNFRDHPNLFLTDIAQAFAICRAVDSPSCKILYDIYHAQIQHGNLIPNMEAAWDEIAYFQIGDNPGRKEPTTGEINYKNVFRYIHSRGFKGVCGMEHGNARPGAEGERALIEAYREVDAFE